MSRPTKDYVKINSTTNTGLVRTNFRGLMDRCDETDRSLATVNKYSRPASNTRKYDRRKLRIREECDAQARPWTSPAGSGHSLSRLSAGSSRSSLDQTNKIQSWLSQKAVRNVQEKADPEAKATKQMYMSVLDTENTFVRDVDNFLLHKAFLDLRRKELLHKKWTETIGDPIQARIYEEMARTYPRLDKQKRRLYEEYLRHGNRKGFVYLDTFDTSEYDPLKLVAPRPAPMRVQVQTNSDPLLQQQRMRDDEDNTVIACKTGDRLSATEMEDHRLPPLPLVPLGRHGTGCNTWLAMPLHNIESPVRKMSRGRMHGAFNNTEFNFTDHSSGLRDSGAVEREMRIQRKRFYTAPPVEQEMLVVDLSPTNSQQNIVCP